MGSTRGRKKSSSAGGSTSQTSSSTGSTTTRRPQAVFNLSSDSDASMSSENCSDAYISDDAKSEYEYESDEDDEFDWAALLDENWDDDQHDDDDEHESDFVDFEEDDERLLDEDVDLGSGGDGSSHEPGDAHAACGGLHSCGGPLHGHLQGLSRHPLLDGGHEADRVPCNAWWQNLCRLCCMYQHAATLKKDRRLASAKDWKRRDALVASRLGLPAPLSAGPEVFDTLPALDGVHVLSVAPRAEDATHLAVALEDYILTGEDNGDIKNPPVADLFNGLVHPDLHGVLPPELQRFIDFRSQRTALRESIDLKHQVFEVNGVPAPYPYHHPDNLDRTSWFENRGKGGGSPQIPRIVIAAIYSNNVGVHDGREAFDQALAALTPLDAAQHSQRKADMPTKREVSMVGKLADTAFDDPQSGIDLNLAETAAKVRSQSVSVASALQAYAPWKKADQELAPFIVEQVKADFIAFVEAFEVELGVTLTKNRRGFPVAPFKPDEEEDDIIRLCGRILICFIVECDEENEDDPNGSPYGVLILIILNEVLSGFRDPLGGFLLDWTFRKYSPTRPTVVAHCYHGVPGRFGLSTPFPKSLSDWNPREMTVRVEAHCTNFLIASHSYAALVRMMQESRVAAEKIRLVLHAQGLMEEPIPLPDFLPSAEFRGLVRFNGVLPFEAKLLFTEEHKPRPGAADASDLYHPRLVEVITKLGLQLPRRDPDVVASIGDFTVATQMLSPALATSPSRA